MNIYGEIKTSLDEIYAGITKEINVKRQVIENNILSFKQFKYIVSLKNDQIIFSNQGDEYYDNDNQDKIVAGDLIIDIICKKHQYFKRVNDFDILVSLPLTLFDLFNGFNKSFDYFLSEKINLIMNNGFGKISCNKKISLQNNFDGSKISIIIPNYGLIDDNELRGNLIIYLVFIYFLSCFIKMTKSHYSQKNLRSCFIFCKSIFGHHHYFDSNFLGPVFLLNGKCDYPVYRLCLR